MMKLEGILKEGNTYQIFPIWSHKESYFVKVMAELREVEHTQYTCKPMDDLQLLELRKRKARTRYLPYNCIRYIEVSPASEITEKLFG